MRKAVQAAARRNQRRKDNPAAPPAEAPTNNVGAVSKEQLQPSPPTVASARTAPTAADVSKRKATAEEAALTAKNYRLAKELSELRVRHREECKNVTRLTMENMNLASRCREALSHVSMLKRELAAHQRRSAEALAMQRQIVERAMASTPGTPAAMPTTPSGSVAQEPTSQGVDTTPKRNLEIATSAPSSSGHVTPPLQQITSPHQIESPVISTPPPKLTPRRAMDVAKELEILDETVASHALKAKATSTTPPPPPPLSSEEPPPPESPPTLSDPVDSDDFEEESLSTTNQLHPPQFVDDVPGHRPAPVEATIPEDANNTSTDTAGSGGSLVSPPKTYFPHSASPKVDNYNEEYPADFSAVRKRAAVRPKLGMLDGFAEGEDEDPPNDIGIKSSLDAFEASFAVDFPDSFSPRDTVAEEKKSEIYNPFNSPARPQPAGQSPQGHRVVVAHQALKPPEPLQHHEPRKDPPGKIRTSQRSMHNKVFTALSHSPRGADESRSPRFASSTRQPSPGGQQPPINGLRANGLNARALNPPPLDTKPTETGRSRYDRLQHQRKVSPFDEPRSEAHAPSTPKRHDPESEEQITPVSVKDRASLFNGGGPRSPERERVRINSLTGRYTYEKSYVDEGDIPMISNIGRTKASPPRQERAATATAMPAGTSSYGSNTSRSPSFAKNRLLPWEADSKDDMEQRRRQFPDSKLRRGEFYSGKSERE